MQKVWKIQFAFWYRLTYITDLYANTKFCLNFVHQIMKMSLEIGLNKRNKSITFKLLKLINPWRCMGRPYIGCFPKCIRLGIWRIFLDTRSMMVGRHIRFRSRWMAFGKYIGWWQHPSILGLGIQHMMVHIFQLGRRIELRSRRWLVVGSHRCCFGSSRLLGLGMEYSLDRRCWLDSCRSLRRHPIGSLVVGKHSRHRWFVLGVRSMSTRG